MNLLSVSRREDVPSVTWVIREGFPESGTRSQRMRSGE